MRRTKMLFTLGPATDRPGVLAGLLKAGMSGARFNLSHGTYQDHRRRFRQLRHAAVASGIPVATLLDLAGPKLRVGKLPGGQMQLENGKQVILSPGPGRQANVIPVSYPALAKDVRLGERLLLDDGMIELKVREKRGADLVCTVAAGGLLLDHKGLNVPGAPLSVPALTAKDLADLRFGLSLGVDYVALSFVRRPEEVVRLRRLAAKNGSRVKIIAKLEKPQAIEHLEGILQAADGVMIARGDLGVEMAPELVPPLQKRIIAMAQREGRLVITATQMLQSMLEHPRPTRAEASDVANAIFDGSDAVMLSGETASGAYPVQAAEMMARIVDEAEASPVYNRLSCSPPSLGPSDSLVAAAVDLAEEIRAQALVVFTQSGNTARLVSRRRPRTRLIAFAHDGGVQRQLNLWWGVHALDIKFQPDIEKVMLAVEQGLRRHRWVRRHDRVVVLASSPVLRRSQVNFLKVLDIR